MGCNCKKDKNGIKTKENQSSNNKKEPLFIRGLVFTTKLIIFLFASLISGIIVVPFSIYMLYKVIFFNKGVDVTGALLTIGKTLKKKDKEYDDDEDEYEFEDESEIELLNTEE